MVRGPLFASVIALFAACDGGGDDSGSDNAVPEPDAATAPGTPDASLVPGTPDASVPGAPDASVPGTPDASGPDVPDATSPEPPDAAIPEPDAGTGSTGCGAAEFLPLPDNTAARGPWPVGVRTASVGQLTVEVWYPATPGSDAGEAQYRYDIRLQLPPSQQDKIPDEANPWQICNCYRDLPLDEGHGPYPVVVFIHGTAGFRTQSVGQMAHWASRGFIVVAADHPGLKLADALSFLCPDDASGSQDMARDVDETLAALTEAAGDFGFTDGFADLDRVAVVGHSAGANAVANLTNRPGVRACIPMAGNTAPAPSATLESSLLLGALSDAVVAYPGTQAAYAATSGEKRLVGLNNSGHLAFSDLCELNNDAGDNIVEIAQEYGVCGVILAGFLFDCNPAYIDPGVRNDIVNFASSAVLEGTLMCSDAEDGFATFEATYSDVAEFRQQP